MYDIRYQTKAYDTSVYLRVFRITGKRSALPVNLLPVSYPKSYGKTLARLPSLELLHPQTRICTTNSKGCRIKTYNTYYLLKIIKILIDRNFDILGFNLR